MPTFTKSKSQFVLVFPCSPYFAVETGLPTDTAVDHLWASAAKVLEPGDNAAIKTWGFAKKMEV
jgi:hypothetical protein